MMVTSERARDSEGIEGFALLARQGREVHASVSVKKSDLSERKSFSSGKRGNWFFEPYVWSGEYVFDVDEVSNIRFSKVYLSGYFFGTEEEKQQAESILCSLANERLSEDCRRLKDSFIDLRGSLFGCFEVSEDADNNENDTPGKPE